MKKNKNRPMKKRVTNTPSSKGRSRKKVDPLIDILLDAISEGKVKCWVIPKSDLDDPRQQS